MDAETSVRLRLRDEADGPGLERLAEVVHDIDGYPLYLPSDLRAFLVAADAYGAWVAEDDGQLVGHVALHAGSWDGVVDLACRATGMAEDEFAVVARLLVSPTVRRRGVGRALLHAAASEAWALGLRPILDVAVRYEAAIRLYEKTGWTRLGTVGFLMPGGETVDEYVYLGPSQGELSGA